MVRLRAFSESILRKRATLTRENSTSPNSSSQAGSGDWVRARRSSCHSSSTFSRAPSTLGQSKPNRAAASPRRGAQARARAPPLPSLLHLLEGALDARPVEAQPGGGLPQALGLSQGRQSLGDLP